jgi:hypothetical protein
VLFIMEVRPGISWRTSSAGCQGQSRVRCRTCRCAERASRAGVLINWVRMVPVRARAWKLEASAPAARVRLCAMAAQISQAPLALKCRRAGGPARSP